MPLSIRDTILAASDIKDELVEVPEWGVTVKVRGMSGAERATWLATAGNDKGGIDPARGYPALIVLCTSDPATGEPVFTAADRDALMLKSGEALDRVALAAMRLSGLTSGAVEAAAKT